MCVIVHQPQQVELSKDTFSKLWERNDDGGGFAFIDETGRIQVHKYMDSKRYWEVYRTWRGRYPNTDFLLHMRIQTHGGVNLENVHPFQIDQHTVLAHNGIISNTYDYKDGRSDTRVFIDNVLSKLPANWYLDDDLKLFVEGAIGGSKLMLLTNNPKAETTTIFFNEKSWSEHEGLKLSNTFGLSSSYRWSDYRDSWKGGHTYYDYTTDKWNRFSKENKEESKDEGPFQEPMLDDSLLTEDFREVRLDWYGIDKFLYEYQGYIICSGCQGAVDDYTMECDCVLDILEVEEDKREDEKTKANFEKLFAL